MSGGLLVALGGAIGARGRYALSTLLFVPGQFPWATLAINIAGSLGIGVLWGIGLQQPWFELWGRHLLVVGLLGGFTTFSAFSMETVSLWEAGRPLGAVGYISASVVGCIAAAWFGQRLSGIG